MRHTLQRDLASTLRTFAPIQNHIVYPFQPVITSVITELVSQLKYIQIYVINLSREASVNIRCFLRRVQIICIRDATFISPFPPSAMESPTPILRLCGMESSISIKHASVCKQDITEFVSSVFSFSSILFFYLFRSNVRINDIQG